MTATAFAIRRWRCAAQGGARGGSECDRPSERESGDRAPRRRPRPRGRAVRRGPVGDAAARRPRRGGDQDRGSGLAAATSAATCRRSRRARTRSSSRRSTAARRASSLDLRDPDAAAPSSRTSCAASTPCSRTCAATSRRSSGSPTTTCSEVNPRIVCCSLSGFGMTGPRAPEGGYDYMMQALAGWMSITGEPGGPPTKSGLSLVDLSGGLRRGDRHAGRRLGARGATASAATATSRSSTPRSPSSCTSARGRRPRGTTPDAAPQLGAPVDRALPELRDGGRLDRGRRAPRRSSGSACATRSSGPSCADDPRSSTSPRARENAERLLGILEPLFRDRSTAEWLERLADVGCAEHAGQRRRRGPRGPSDRRAPERRRGRPPAPRGRAAGGDATSAERRRGTAPSGTVPRVSTRNGCSRRCAATRRTSCRVWPRRGSSAIRQAASMAQHGATGRPGSPPDASPCARALW